jgi:uncharacterized paraquat-inducible protein A
MIICCPDCGRRLRVPDGVAGRRARCPACKSKFDIPDPQAQDFETIAGFILPDPQQSKQSAD